MLDTYIKQTHRESTNERTIHSQVVDSSISRGWSFFLQIEKWGRMGLKCEGWNTKIEMDDRYARQIQNDHRESSKERTIHRQGWIAGGYFHRDSSGNRSGRSSFFSSRPSSFLLCFAVVVTLIGSSGSDQWSGWLLLRCSRLWKRRRRRRRC